MTGTTQDEEVIRTNVMPWNLIKKYILISLVTKVNKPRTCYEQNKFRHNIVLIFLLYVGATVTFRTIYPPFLNFGYRISYRSLPSCVTACSRLEFSLKWRAASCNLIIGK